MGVLPVCEATKHAKLSISHWIVKVSWFRERERETSGTHSEKRVSKRGSLEI